VHVKSIVSEDVHYDKVRYIGVTEAYERFCTKPTECAFFSFMLIIFANLRVFGAKKEKIRRNAVMTHA
jgi:hypothetical protein